MHHYLYVGDNLTDVRSTHKIPLYRNGSDNGKGAIFFFFFSFSFLNFCNILSTNVFKGDTSLTDLKSVHILEHSSHSWYVLFFKLQENFCTSLHSTYSTNYILAESIIVNFRLVLFILNTTHVYVSVHKLIITKHLIKWCSRGMAEI